MGYVGWKKHTVQNEQLREYEGEERKFIDLVAPQVVRRFGEREQFLTIRVELEEKKQYIYSRLLHILVDIFFKEKGSVNVIFISTPTKTNITITWVCWFYTTQERTSGLKIHVLL